MNDKPIRVLIVNGKMICGGVEAFIMNIYRHIDRSKIQFDFLVHYKDRFFYDDEIEKLGGKIYRLTFRNDNNYFKYKKDLQKFFTEHKEYQIVWGHMDGLAGIYLKIAKKCGVKVTIAHSHITSAEHSLKGLIKRLLRHGVRKYSDYKFACSTEAGIYLYGKRSKFELIPNAIDVDRFDYSEGLRKKIREENGWGKDTLVVGHVGRFNEQKNHKYLIDIFYQLHKMRLNSVLCLCGDGELREEIEKKVMALGLSENVIFKGNIPNVNEYYQAFDIFVMPSLYEGLPVSGIEAQASGLKCIFADTITRETDIVHENVSFLPITVDPNMWADDIIKLKEYNRFGYKPNIIAAGYSIDDEAKMLEEFLQRRML